MEILFVLHVPVKLSTKTQNKNITLKFAKSTGLLSTVHNCSMKINYVQAVLSIAVADRGI